MDAELMPGVRIRIAAGGMDRPRTFTARPLRPDEISQLQDRFPKGLFVVGGIDLDGGMAPADRLRRPLEVEIDLAAAGVPESGRPVTSMWSIDGDGVPREIPCSAEGSVRRFTEWHNGPLAYVAGGAFLIGFALYAKGEIAETEGIDWAYMHTSSGRFKIHWPRSEWPGDDEASRLLGERDRCLTEYVNFLALNSSVPRLGAPRFSDLPPEHPLRRLTDIEAITSDPAWVRAHFAPPLALSAGGFLEECLTYLTSDLGIRPPAKGVNVYIRNHPADTALGDQQQGFGRRAWMSMNRARYGPLSSGGDLCAGAAGGAKLEVTLLHELFHVCQVEYLESDSTVWAVEAAAVVLEAIAEADGSSDDRLDDHFGNGAAFTDARTDFWTHEGYLREPLAIAEGLAATVGASGSTVVQEHGYSASILLDDIRAELWAGDPDFLSTYMEELARSGSGISAFRRMAAGPGMSGFGKQVTDVVNGRSETYRKGDGSLSLAYRRFADDERVASRILKKAIEPPPAPPRPPWKIRLTGSTWMEFGPADLPPLASPIWEFVFAESVVRRPGSVFVVETAGMGNWPTRLRFQSGMPDATWRENWRWGKVDPSATTMEPAGLVVPRADGEWADLPKSPCVLVPPRTFASALQVVCAFEDEEAAQYPDRAVRLWALLTLPPPRAAGPDGKPVESIDKTESLDLQIQPTPVGSAPGFHGYRVHLRLSDRSGQTRFERAITRIPDTVHPPVNGSKGGGGHAAATGRPHHSVKLDLTEELESAPADAVGGTLEIRCSEVISTDETAVCGPMGEPLILPVSRTVRLEDLVPPPEFFAPCVLVDRTSTGPVEGSKYRTNDIKVAYGRARKEGSDDNRDPSAEEMDAIYAELVLAVQVTISRFEDPGLIDEFVQGLGDHFSSLGAKKESGPGWYYVEEAPILYLRRVRDVVVMIRASTGGEESQKKRRLLLQRICDRILAAYGASER